MSSLLHFTPCAGTFAVVSIMCSNAVQGVLDTIKVPTDGPITDPSMSIATQYNYSTPVPTTNQYLEAEKIKIHTALCLLVGLFQVRKTWTVTSLCPKESDWI